MLSEELFFGKKNAISNMKYRHILIIFFTAICSCISKVSDSAVVDYVQQNHLANVVDTLYDFVSKIYKHDFMKPKAEVLDSLYLSSELYYLEKKYKESDPDTYHNLWLCGDFAHNPSFKIGKITHLSDTTSTVGVYISNGDNQLGYQLHLLLENGKWKVDDFIYDTGTTKSSLRKELGLETPLRGSLSEYSLKFCENPENQHEAAINLYRKKTVVSQNIVDVGGNKTFEGIADTKEGFNISYSWGHNKYFGNTIFLFKYLKGQFYLYKIIRYYSVEIEEGFEFKNMEKNLETPILFQDVDFEKYLY